MKIQHSWLTLLWLFGLSACAASETAPTYPVPDYATATLDLSSPQATAHSMMMAMYRGDAAMIDRVFAETGTLRRVGTDGSATGDGRARWQEWVGTLKVGQAHEEIFGLRVQQYENLATVWAPFVITLDGNLVGCGVNHLAMAKQAGEWRIVTGMDTAAPKGTCEAFRESYAAR